MFSRPLLLRVLPLAMTVLFTACGASHHPAVVAANKTVDDRFAIKVGGQVVRMQIAALPDEMEKGLMFRRTMAADEGMLFIFDRPQQVGFWMRNTILPLDVGYFRADGELQEIYPMYPHDEKTVASHSRDIQFCLEMNQGWYDKAGIHPGAMLDLKAVTEALQARGLKPAALGLH